MWCSFARLGCNDQYPEWLRTTNGPNGWAISENGDWPDYETPAVIASSCALCTATCFVRLFTLSSVDRSSLRVFDGLNGTMERFFFAAELVSVQK